MTPDPELLQQYAAADQVALTQVLREEPGAHGAGFSPDLAADPQFRTLHTQNQHADGRVRERDIVFQQQPDGWHIVSPPWLVDKSAELLKPRPANAKHDGGG